MKRAALLFLIVPWSVAHAAATLSLTAAGTSNGFLLTKFATIDSTANSNTGVYGVAVTSTGTVLVSNFSNDTRYVFNDVDGQTPGTALATITPSSSFSGAYANAGGQAYGQVSSQFVQFNPNGTVNRILTGISQSPFFGMWGNPKNGHILSTTGQGQIIDINPAGAGSAMVVATTGTGYDGVTVSPDGTIVYVELNQHIVGFNIATGTQVFDSGVLFGFPDGTGIITSSGPLNGKLIVNFNGVGPNAGFVGLLDPVTKTVTTIASGGTRGDYVSPDPSNGTVFLSYSDSVYRLSCGSGCSIGTVVSGPALTPAPSSLMLVLIGLAVGGAYLMRRRLLHQRS